MSDSYRGNRSIIAAALCDAENGNGAWERLSSDHHTKWLHRTDEVTRELANRDRIVAMICELAPLASLSQNPTSNDAEEWDSITDNRAVRRFASLMIGRLALARAKGRRGWQDCSEATLVGMLHEHVSKGDMLDVANIAMMIHLNKIRTADI